MNTTKSIYLFLMIFACLIIAGSKSSFAQDAAQQDQPVATDQAKSDLSQEDKDRDAAILTDELKTKEQDAKDMAQEMKDMPQDMKDTDPVLNAENADLSQQ